MSLVIGGFMVVQFADHLKDIPDYIPGKPVDELKRDLGIDNIVKMASNENFWGPSQRVSKTIADKIQLLNFYPDSGCFLLRDALSKKLRVQTDQIIVGPGSSYIIELICRSFLNPGDEGITCDLTFPFYERAIKGAIGKHKSIPLKNFDVDIDALLNGISDQSRVIFLASPNNPTGKIISFRKLKTFMDHLDPGILVALDEAYFDFVNLPEAESGLEILKNHQNLIVLKSFSKIYGLAGLRIGYGVAHSTIIRALMKLIIPFSVNTLSQAAALAYIDEEDYLNEIRRINEEGREYFYKELRNLCLEFVPTQANFILVRVGRATKVYEDLLKKGIIVRDMTLWKLPEYIRITISLPENNERLIRELGNEVSNKV